MKTLIVMAVWSSMPADGNVRPFNLKQVEMAEHQNYEALQTNATALQWKEASTDELKGQKFDKLLAEMGNPALTRPWNYPDHPTWPLVDWDNVAKLEDFLDDQVKVVDADPFNLKSPKN